MNKTQLAKELNTLKTELAKRGISTRDLEKTIDVDHSTIVLILNDKYTGSQETKDRVINLIKFIVECKQDLNSLIYPNAAVFLKAMRLAVENRNTSIEEKLTLVKICEPISEYIEANKETDSDRDSN